MKKNLIKILSGALLIGSLFSMPASAYTLGWNKDRQIDATRTSYKYVFYNGQFAVGWQLIQGDWYYFDKTTFSSYVGTATYNSKSNCWMNATMVTIDGRGYYFDTQGKLLRNTVVTVGSLHFRYTLDKDGHTIAQ